MKPNYNKYQDNTGKIKLKVHLPRTRIDVLECYQLAKGTCTKIEGRICIKGTLVSNSGC